MKNTDYILSQKHADINTNLYFAFYNFSFIQFPSGFFPSYNGDSGQ